MEPKIIQNEKSARLKMRTFTGISLKHISLVTPAPTSHMACALTV